MPSNYSCIIVDDEQDAIELIKDRLGKLFRNITVTDTYSRWEDALTGLRDQVCDLLLMDISMPGKNSIELLKLLPQLDAEIIFITAHEQYAIEAFAFTTSGYILKPVDDAELVAAINKAVIRIQNKKLSRQTGALQIPDEKIGIPNNHGIDYINISDILYLESANKCTKIVTARSEYISATHLGRFKNLIDNHSFFQAHRSYIINLNSILRYESSGLIIMSDKKEIPLSRSVRNDFLKLFNSNY